MIKVVRLQLIDDGYGKSPEEFEGAINQAAADLTAAHPDKIVTFVQVFYDHAGRFNAIFNVD